MIYQPTTPREAFEVTTCGGKDRYPSPQIAHRRLREMKRKFKKNRLVVYRCAVCNQWHLGSAKR